MQLSYHKRSERSKEFTQPISEKNDFSVKIQVEVPMQENVLLIPIVFSGN